MERKKASDYPQEVLNLFDHYMHGEIDRRGFLEGAQKFAIGGLTATAILESLRPNFAWAQQVPVNDSRLKIEFDTVQSPKGYGTIKGYYARPAHMTGKLPGVMVIHENRGLNPYIEDVARRLAIANFIVFAPDALTSLGGYPGDTTTDANEQKAVKMFSTLDQKKIEQDFLASFAWLKARPECTGRVGIVGFCYGGSMTNRLAVDLGDDLAAGVAFYGGQPSTDDAHEIKAPLLLHYGSLDTRITSGWPAYDEALNSVGDVHEGYVYQGANHGFHNDTTPRYDAAAAKLAWQRTMAWFNKYLRTPEERS